MPATFPVRVHLAPGGRPGDRARDEELEVPEGWTLRDILRKLSVPVEGCALWWNGEPVPSDLPVASAGELEVVPTFSGG
jgi:sulfur carrier protein ThiS